MEFKVRTKGDSQPQGKRRVYFTCHPDDFERCFEQICDEVFLTQNCAIYYADDMAAAYENDVALELSQMNLFLIPISLKTLTEPNRAVDFDFAFAKERHVPVLPILIDYDLNETYAEKFGTLEYLDRVGSDVTALSYEDKLEKFLNAVLVSDEMAEKVRAAFDAYVFMSYRKKDRKYANELMRLIHDNPICRDVAIWYDEFLVPGEDFEGAIKKALEKSDLFTMVVTPNLMEEGNYVQRIEYPEANRIGKRILPVEMQDTNEEKLKEMYQGIPDCVKGRRDDAFYGRIAELLADQGKKERKESPEHNFLIGLAYLSGIDVEKNDERALELIQDAAEAGLVEAIEKLADMYLLGCAVERDRNKWKESIEKANSQAEKIYDESDRRLWDVRHELAFCCNEMGEYERALEISEKVWEWRKKNMGAESQEALTDGELVLRSYRNAGLYGKVIEIGEELTEVQKRILGESHQMTIMSEWEMIIACRCMGRYDRALEMGERLLNVIRQNKGKNDYVEALILNEIGGVAYTRGEYRKAAELIEKCFQIMQKSLTVDSIRVSCLRNNTAAAYAGCGEHEKAIQLYQESLECMKAKFGEDNAQTVNTLASLGAIYAKAEKYDKAVETLEVACEKRKAIFGEEHPETLLSLANLSVAYAGVGEFGKAVAIGEELVEKFPKVLGEGHPFVIRIISNLASIYRKKGDAKKALEVARQAYEKGKALFGEKHFIMLSTRMELAECHAAAGDYAAATESAEGTYDDYVEQHGVDYPEAMRIRKKLDEYKRKLCRN